MENTGTVSIYIPTYRHHSIFEACLDSYLRQSYSNLVINVFDNGFAEGFEEIKEVIDRKNDRRINYFPNNSNIGPVGNYNQIFRTISGDEKVIVAASDMGVSDTAVEVLLNNMMAHKCSVVMPRAENYDSKIVNENGLPTYEQEPSIVDSIFGCDHRVFSGAQLLNYFFGEENIKSEFYNFSIFGALIDGALIKGILKNHAAFRFHGFEQILSMEIALNAPRIAVIPDICFKCFIGQKRIGGTERSNDYMTRLQPILAAQRFLDENEAALVANHLDVFSYRRFQIRKIRFFRKHYAGYWAILSAISLKNRALLLLKMIEKGLDVLGLSRKF